METRKLSFDEMSLANGGLEKGTMCGFYVGAALCFPFPALFIAAAIVCTIDNPL